MRTLSESRPSSTQQPQNSFKLPSYSTCLQAMIRPKTFKQIKFYLELSVKDKKIADIAYKTLTSQNVSRATTSHNATRGE